MKEWNDKYNPFNSYKGLIWRENYEAIVKGKFLPPVTVDTDPANKCNFKCIWCNAKEYIDKDPQCIPTEHLVRLAAFYKEWGVKSTCIAGGGEPFMNGGMNTFLYELKECGIESGVISNGSLWSSANIDAMADNCKWVGISVDAATTRTFNRIKGISNIGIFSKVQDNIKRLNEKIALSGSECRVCFKFLLHPINLAEVYKAAKLAKDLGCKDFHLRPVGWDNLAVTKDKKKLSFDVKEAQRQIAMAMTLEEETFRVYGVNHKFNPDMTKKVNFKKCLATPLLATFGADGNCHLCFDMRGREDLILCSHYPDPSKVAKFWGSDKHKRIIESINVGDCPRCTFGPYNEFIEHIFINDNMCRNFP